MGTLSRLSLQKGTVKDMGLAKSPTKKARGKFKVANEDRNMPRRSNEKHLARR